MGDKEKLKELQAKAQRLLDTAKGEKRDMNDTEKAEFDDLQRQIDELARKLEDRNGNPEAEGERAAIERGIENERKRAVAITELCKQHGVDPTPYIKENKTMEEVQRSILDKLEREKGPINTGVRVDMDEADKFRRAAADGMVMRGGVQIDKPADGARDFRGTSLKDLAIRCMERDGEDVKDLILRSTDDIYGMLCRQFYNPSASFPAIMDQAINKAYVEGHNKAQATFDRWVKKGTLKDFKSIKHEYIAGPAGDFYEVPENGEIKHDIPKDIKRPNRQIKTYGRQFTMTRQAFINDDIGFLSTIPARYAAAARRTQNKQAYEILFANDEMYDGVPLFDVKHNNIIKTGSAPTKEAFQKMLLKLQMMRDEFGEAINIRPAKILVPVGYAFDMFTVFNSPTIQTSENTQAANPLYNYRTMIEIIEDATINALAESGKAVPWFLVGAAEDVDGVWVDYLNGDEIPKIRRMEAPGTLGYVWDIFLDWGFSVVDYRGIIKNPGTVITIE